MENKKTKLTISGNPKKTVQNFSQSRPIGKKTVVIDKQQGKNININNIVYQGQNSGHYYAPERVSQSSLA